MSQGNIGGVPRLRCFIRECKLIQNEPLASTKRRHNLADSRQNKGTKMARRSKLRGFVSPHFHRLRIVLQLAVKHQRKSQGRNRVSKGFKPAACFDIWLATFHIMEMLYDTPFPESPQTDRIPEKADRNTEIIARHETGETGASLAQAYGISEQRVNQIVHGRRS